MALLRVPMIQIVALIVGLLIASFLQIPLVSVVLAEVRLLLVMVFGVALIYTGVLQRRDALKPAPLVVYEPWVQDELVAIERGH